MKFEFYTKHLFFSSFLALSMPFVAMAVGDDETIPMTLPKHPQKYEFPVGFKPQEYLEINGLRARWNDAKRRQGLDAAQTEAKWKAESIT